MAWLQRGTLPEPMTTDFTDPYMLQYVNRLKPRQNGRHFPDDILKCIFLNENVYISIKFSLKFVPRGSINNIPAIVQIMAWRRPGDKPLSEPIVFSLVYWRIYASPSLHVLMISIYHLGDWHWWQKWPNGVINCILPRACQCVLR